MSIQTSHGGHTLPTAYRAPQDLRPDPLIKHMPRPDREDPRWHAFVSDIADHGVLEALKITKAGVVLDGETRRQAAIAAGIAQVPVEIVPDDQAHSVILRHLGFRRNLTKGQLAYIAVPLLDAAFAESARRKKAGPSASTRQRVTLSVEDVAEGLGISAQTLRQARQVREAMDAYPDPELWQGQEEPIRLRDLLEPRILDWEDPMGLPAALKAIGYWTSVHTGKTQPTGGPPTAPEQKVLLILQSAQQLAGRMEYLAEVGKENMTVFWGHIRRHAADLPPERCQALAEQYTALAKQYATAAKQER